jgi:hypothetical protein
MNEDGNMITLLLLLLFPVDAEISIVMLTEGAALSDIVIPASVNESAYVADIAE